MNPSNVVRFFQGSSSALDGVAILGDSTDPEIQQFVVDLISGPLALIDADPPYGKIVSAKWDHEITEEAEFVQWMLDWTRAWQQHLRDGGAFYIWGGIGTPGFRPFFRFLPEAEVPGQFELANLITWKKKRAYGVQHNYLFTREELAYFTRGAANKPHRFEIPLLEEKRGYAGYNAKYPAKSEYLRRSNVWTDITEVLRNKLHQCQKPQKVYEIPIEVHTDIGEWVLDPFAGSAPLAKAARDLDRRFVVIEKDPDTFDALVADLRS